MIKRNYGENTTFETRAESNDSINREKRYKQILYCLGSCEFTAKELAVLMCLQGYIPTAERNFTAPRLTEMMGKGLVEPVGKKRCTYTGKTVTVYRRRDVPQF